MRYEKKKYQKKSVRVCRIVCVCVCAQSQKATKIVAAWHFISTHNHPRLEARLQHPALGALLDKCFLILSKPFHRRGDSLRCWINASVSKAHISPLFAQVCVPSRKKHFVLWPRKLNSLHHRFMAVSWWLRALLAWNVSSLKLRLVPGSKLLPMI